MQNTPEMKTTQILSSEMLRQLRLRGFAVSHPDELNFEELAEIFWLIRSAGDTVNTSPRGLGLREE